MSDDGKVDAVCMKGCGQICRGCACANNRYSLAPKLLDRSVRRAVRHELAGQATKLSRHVIKVGDPHRQDHVTRLYHVAVPKS